MNINDVLREKRKELKLTQEQVANYLGITAPAVNKWEKGLCCPDITLLPTLARLLKTDPNTLLCFKENLSDHEIGLFVNEVGETIQNNGFKQGFSLAMDQIREYPHCGKLKQNLALVLEGGVVTSNLSEEENKNYSLKIDKLYEQVALYDDENLANNAKFILASKHLKRKEFDKAQDLLDQMPQKSEIPDKQTLQATLLSMQGNNEEAAKILERIALSSLQETLIAVTKLIPILVSENKLSQAQKLAKASQIQYEAFGLSKYSAYIAPMQLAVSIKNIPETIAAISKMLEATITPWNISTCPLYLHQPQKKDSENMGQTFLQSLLLILQNSTEYSFLQNTPEFHQLIEKYNKKIKSK